MHTYIHTTYIHRQTYIAHMSVRAPAHPCPGMGPNTAYTSPSCIYLYTHTHIPIYIHTCIHAYTPLWPSMGPSSA